MTNSDYSDHLRENNPDTLGKLAHTAAPDLAEQFFKYVRLAPEASPEISYIRKFDGPVQEPLDPSEAGHILTISAAPDLAELFFKRVSSEGSRI